MHDGQAKNSEAAVDQVHPGSIVNGAAELLHGNAELGSKHLDHRHVHHPRSLLRSQPISEETP